jgi:hypothetical protein
MTVAQTLLVLAMLPLAAALLAGTLGACVAAITWIALAVRADAARSLLAAALAAHQPGADGGWHAALAVA